MPDSLDLAREQAAWLAAGTVPRVSGLDGDMVAMALLDLHVLSRPYGVPVAGWSPPVALRVAARLGAGSLGAGSYRARLPTPNASSTSCSECSRSRDCSRPATCPMAVAFRMIGASSWMASVGLCGQLDRWRPSSHESDRTAFVQRHRMLLDRSTQAALSSIDNRSSLPPPSADYWEVKERRLTLATAAVLCAGLEAGAELYRILGDVRAADHAAAGGAPAARRDQDKLRKERLSAAPRRAQRQHRPGSRFSAAARRLKR